MSVKTDIVLRVRIAFLLVALFGVLIILKIGKIQIIDGKKWKDKAASISFSERQIKATRGNIYAADGSLLSTSLPFYRVAFDPSVLEDEDLFNDKVDSLALMLSKFFQDKSQKSYKHALVNAREKRKRYLRIGNRSINYHDKKELSKFPIFRLGRYTGGVIFEKTDRRFPPFANLARRAIGSIKEEVDSASGALKYRGVGLEYSFNEYLAGKNGYGMFQRIAGTWVPLLEGEESEPENGMDVYTTIDINIQDVVENALMRAMEDNQAEYGTAILMEVKTGEIKAMANLGHSKGGDKYFETYNYAVGEIGCVEPGSTMKLASMIALFEKTNNKLKLKDTINTFNGVHRIYDRDMTDSKPGGYGSITVEEVLGKSSNIGVSRLVERYFGKNPQRFIDYLYDMGLNEPVGFQIQGEAIPKIKTPKDETWSGTSLAWMSIGYELELSPIQTLTFYNAVANNGVKVQPIIVKEIRNADEVMEQYETKVLNKKICSKETLKKVQKQLEGVVKRGTAKGINTRKYQIAGKTGTAQKLKNGQYTKIYSTSFVGYFPADNPKYSCIVVVDSPKGFRKEGSNTAAPVFREISDKVYSRDLSLHKDAKLKKPSENGVFPQIKGGNQEELQSLCNEFGISAHSGNHAEYVRTAVRDNSVRFVSKKMQDGLVPNVLGLRLKDALYVLENQGLKVTFTGSGRVAKQSQKSGIKALRGSEIKLELK